MSTPQQKLKAEAKKYLNLKDLFPRHKPDLRTKLSEYQVKKIRSAIKQVKHNSGEYFNQVVPMGHGRKKYMKQAGLPIWQAGIPLSGGAKKNKKLNYVKGELRYERGEHNAQRAIIEIDTRHGEEGVIKSMKAILKNRKGRRVHATANNRVIGSTMPKMNDKIFISETLAVFNKYENAFKANGLVDQNTEDIPENLFVDENNEVWRYIGGDVKKPVKVAPPSEWGMGILFEGAIKSKGKKK